MHETEETRQESKGLAWDAVDELARSLPAKHNLVIPKSAVAGPPPFSTTRLGRPYGCRRQYRCNRARQNLHVKEYDDRWVVHVDAYNPAKHAIRHLLLDHGFDRFVELARWRPHLVPQGSAAES